MANNQKVEQNNVATEKATEQQNVQVQAVPTEQATQPVVAQESGFKPWLKKHWKGVTGAAAGLATAVATTWVAYKKGKAAGIMSVPMPQQDPEDYSLDPNRE